MADLLDLLVLLASVAIACASIVQAVNVSRKR
jgi:hypothetical protein